MAFAEMAPDADTGDLCIICTTMGQHFYWYRASHGSLGDSWVSCFVLSHMVDCKPNVFHSDFI